MSFLEWGGVRGLARDFGYKQQADDMLIQAKMMEDARARAEAKAKLQADELQHDTPMNEIDRPLAEAAARQHLIDIANIYKAYGNNMNNFQVQSMLAEKKKALKEDENIVRGLMNDAEIKKHEAFLQDPKNAELAKTDDFKQNTLELQNFKDPNIQSADGKPKTFKFRAPGADFDFAKFMDDARSQTEYDTVDHPMNGYVVTSLSPVKRLAKAKEILQGKDAAKVINAFEKNAEAVVKYGKNGVTNYVADQLTRPEKVVNGMQDKVQPHSKDYDAEYRLWLLKQKAMHDNGWGGSGKTQGPHTEKAYQTMLRTAMGTGSAVMNKAGFIDPKYKIGGSSNYAFGDLSLVNPSDGVLIPVNYDDVATYTPKGILHYDKSKDQYYFETDLMINKDYADNNVYVPGGKDKISDIFSDKITEQKTKNGTQEFLHLTGRKYIPNDEISDLETMNRYDQKTPMKTPSNRIIHDVNGQTVAVQPQSTQSAPSLLPKSLQGKPEGFTFKDSKGNVGILVKDANGNLVIKKQ